MPLYVYHCKHCGNNFEKMVRFSEGNLLPECPECKSQETQKRITTFATSGGNQFGQTSPSCGSSGRFT